MLHEFLVENRSQLIDRCREKVAGRTAPRATAVELDYGVPLFLDQLIKTLRDRPRIVANPDFRGVPQADSTVTLMGRTAALHGAELLQHGFSIDQVVHDYGDLCQAITELALEEKAPITVDEFRTLNQALDNAIADAVREYAAERDSQVARRGELAENERLGMFAHELRNFLHTATLALSAIKAGNVGVSGATAGVLDRSLIGLQNLVDRSLVTVRARAGVQPELKLWSLAEFITDVKVAATLEARARECAFTVSDVDPTLAVLADRDLLFAAVGNLLQNAFKFTRRHSEVALDAYAAGERIEIEVRDMCGGLPAGTAQVLFAPFKQAGNDTSGMGLGLSIARQSVEANHGSLTVRDIPGSGCVFTVDLPRHAMPRRVASAAAATVRAAPEGS